MTGSINFWWLALGAVVFVAAVNYVALADNLWPDLGAGAKWLNFVILPSIAAGCFIGFCIIKAWL
jgi:hypothetical protein